MRRSTPRRRCPRTSARSGPSPPPTAAASCPRSPTAPSDRPGSSDTVLTPSVWPSKVRRQRPVATSQSLQRLVVAPRQRPAAVGAQADGLTPHGVPLEDGRSPTSSQPCPLRDQGKLGPHGQALRLPPSPRNRPSFSQKPLVQKRTAPRSAPPPPPSGALAPRAQSPSVVVRLHARQAKGGNKRQSRQRHSHNRSVPTGSLHSA